jgi:hypothetical protein
MTELIRKTISLPTYLLPYIDSCGNFSEVVKRLIDENLTRLEDSTLETSLEERKEAAREKIYRMFMRLAEEHSEVRRQSNERMIDHYMNEIREDMNKLEHTEKRMEFILHELSKLKDIMKMDKETLKSSIIECCNEILEDKEDE